MSENNQDRTTHFLASTFTLLIVSWLVYACRLYTRLRLVKRIFSEDVFVTIAMASLTVFAAMVPVQTSHGGGRHLADLPNPAQELPHWGRAFFVAQIMYLITLWGVKLSVAFLLLRFSTSKAVTWTLRSTVAVITCLTLGFILWVTFMCTPVQAQWDPSVNGSCASRESYTTSVYVLSAISAVTDIIMAVMPVFILQSLSIDWRTRCYAVATMGLGSLACIVTLIRFKYIRDFSISEDLTYTMVPLSICSFIEVSLGCICASLATLRPLLQQMGMATRSYHVSEEEAQSRLFEFSRSKTNVNDGHRETEV